MAVAVLIFLTIFSSIILRKSWTLNSDAITTTKTEVSSSSVLLTDIHPRHPHIAPGELPGYTGWLRPAISVAGSLGISHQSCSSGIIQEGEEWTCLIICHTERCKTLNTWFYVRAYGPSVITGTVEKIESGHYRLVLQPFLAGTYFVEAIVTYSHVPPVEAFPLRPKEKEPLYEGYMIKDFPLLLKVQPRPRKVAENLKPWCRKEQLQSLDRSSWVVTGLNRLVSLNSTDQVLSQASLEGYQNDTNSMGIQLDFRLEDCRLLPLSTMVQSSCARDQLKHITFIGDSVSRIQIKTLEQLMPSIIIESFELKGGTLLCERNGTTLPGGSQGPIVSKIQKAIPTSSVVVFNTGLHDVHTLCSKALRDERDSYLTTHEQHQNCLTNYQQALDVLAETVQEIASPVRIFQTTSASWPRYGNVAMGWDPKRLQGLPHDPGFIQVFNKVAFRKFESASSVDIVDVFPPAYSRPDHREIVAKANTGRRMAHPGQQIVDVMIQMWMHVALETLCPQLFTTVR